LEEEEEQQQQQQPFGTVVRRQRHLHRKEEEEQQPPQQQQQQQEERRRGARWRYEKVASSPPAPTMLHAARGVSPRFEGRPGDDKQPSGLLVLLA
jgi:hypothetical protein